MTRPAGSPDTVIVRSLGDRAGPRPCQRRDRRLRRGRADGDPVTGSGRRPISSAVLVSMITLPRPTITRRPAVSCSSLIRWLDTSTARPFGGQRGQEPAHPDDALGVHAVERLIQHQDRRVAEQRRGDPQPLPHAEGVPARLPPRRCLQADLGEHRIGPAAGRPWDRASHSRWLRPVRPGCSADASSSDPITGQRTAQRLGKRSPHTSAWPASGTSRPRITRIVVDFPAPFGPTNPVTCPGWTVNDIPSRATVRPNRFRSPATSIVS